MGQFDPNKINRLIGGFTDLQEQWENDPAAFDWTSLQALAQEGASAYNEGTGPSFHALALDGVIHGEFHERFLAFSLEAGFDPFKLVRAGSGGTELPVLDHSDLADASLSNPSSARMRTTLMELARARFTPLAQEIQAGKQATSPWSFRVMEACAESIPVDILEQISPELAKSHHDQKRKQSVDPIEGYLTSAELIIESNSKPYG